MTAVAARTRGRRPRHRVAQVRDPAVLGRFSGEALQRAYDAGRTGRTHTVSPAPTHLTLHSGAFARDRETGRTCRVVSRVWGGGAWNVRFPGDDELVERPADKLEAIEDPAQPAWKPPRAP